MGDLIPSQHMINVFEVFGWALADTVRELDHVQRREDITAKNFITVLSSKVQHLDSDAKRLGVDVRFVSELVFRSSRYSFIHSGSSSHGAGHPSPCLVPPGR